MLAQMSGWDWFLLIIATIIAAGIVKRSKWPNIAIIPVVLTVWLLSYVVLWILKWTIFMAIIVVIGLGIWFYVRKITTPTPPRRK